MHIDTLIINIGQLHSFGSSDRARFGIEMEDSCLLTDSAIAISGGIITEIGASSDLEKKYSWDTCIDAKGKLVLPGFVDCHTHPIFVHTREDEFAQRLAGKSYVEIALAGGGIRSTIQSTRNADEDLLFELAKHRIQKMIALGTTTLEAKSGYGLDTESELKQLRVIKRLADELPINIIPTFMGAHEFPAEYKNDHAAYINILCHEMIPAVAEQGIAEFCDIFTEAHVYSLEETRRVLSCAKAHGLKLKMHADEIEPMGGAELAAELGCVSADHLGRTGTKGIIAMQKAGVIPVLLPATLFSLRSSSYADARQMQELGLPLAIATDYNPGSCNCDSLPITITLACLQMGLSPTAAICAATLNAAYALDRGKMLGSLEPGKQADLTLWEIPSLNFIPYHFGSSNLTRVIIKGKTVYQAS
jgi:imidazolonepropionase